ncbi:tripartite tricarboxylate transporter substrate binding protein [Reyranella sp. CPCC 100927]|uniref:Bug family tripartite tricarboxylate transporter substrate binding protein n=1 Tax=Reyranella sp. CPCC 100927 TaxID=2599616 RepID=UPI0011B704F1|nr:tripartite tricarboxylate transporter substrate binding protein [Reyranella sp. CPCC 100927]TWT15877.1 tripartite tricarboxylate transporter substrate binding protein [Reyranella sp. CPCC 100927]
MLLPLPRAARAALLAVMVLAAVPAMAQDWPTAKPITILMGFPAGSGTDVVARTLQEPLEKELGAKVVIDYRPGAGGNVASEAVARAKPDGYTLLLGTAATHGVNAALYKRLPFDVEADFTPIAPLVDVSNVLTVNPDVIDVTSVKAFIDTVKANPGKYNYASTGNGTGTHLAFAEFVARAGLQMVHVPYKGGPEALQGVLKGDVCCIFNQVQTVLAQWRAGKVRLLGVTTKTRVAAVADIPTIDEAGVPGYESYTWFGLFGPKDLDPKIAARINAAVKATLELPALRQKFLETGLAPRIESVEQFRATVKTNRAKWAEVVKAVGATVD